MKKIIISAGETFGSNILDLVDNGFSLILDEEQTIIKQVGKQLGNKIYKANSNKEGYNITLTKGQLIEALKEVSRGGFLMNGISSNLK